MSGCGLCREKPSAVTPVTQPVRHARPDCAVEGETSPLPWIWLMVRLSHGAGAHSPGITSACARPDCGLSYAALRPITVAGQPSFRPAVLMPVCFSRKMAASPTRKRRSPRRETEPVTDTSRPSVASPILPGSITCGCGGFPAPRRTTCAGEAGSSSNRPWYSAELARNADVVARQPTPGRSPCCGRRTGRRIASCTAKDCPAGERAGRDGHDPAHGRLRVDGQTCGPRRWTARRGRDRPRPLSWSRGEPERKQAAKNQISQHAKTPYRFVKCVDDRVGRGLARGRVTNLASVVPRRSHGGQTVSGAGLNGRNDGV